MSRSRGSERSWVSDRSRAAGPVNFWRVRVGDYRIVYTIKDDILLVLVLRVGHRREIYRLVLPMLDLTSDEDCEP